MELNRHICTQLIEKSKSFSQITLDDNYIIRDNKPDVVRIIYSKGYIRIEEAKAGNQGVWITGKLLFSTLYQSDDGNHRLESINGEVPFQEKIVLDDISEGDDVVVNMDVEDLSISIINSRKLSIRAVANVNAQNLEEVDYTLTAHILDTGYEQKTADHSILCLVQNTKDQLRMQREILLPNSRSNIGELTFYQVDFRNEEIQLNDDHAELKLDAHIWVLYRSETSGEYECFETVIPLSGELEVDTLRGDEIFWSKVYPLEVDVEPRIDYDGESRMLGFDLILAIDMQIYREEEVCILQDAYALDKELSIYPEQIPLHQLLMKNISKIRLLEQQELDPHQQHILQICGSSGNISIDRVHKRDNGVLVEGILNVHILYNTTDDGMPFAHTSSQLPFEQFIEIDGFSENSLWWIQDNIEQLQVNLLDSNEFEIKALLQIAILATNQQFVSNISSISEAELDIEALQKEPGMIGYIRRDGEDLWDVAKKYHATCDNMLEIGNKVLIIKQVR